MSTELKSLDAGSCIISGKTAIISEMIREMVKTGFFSEDTLICVKVAVNGCDFKIQGLQSEVNKVISTIRPYPGSGPVEVGHTYRGKHTGHNAVAVFVSEHYIVSRYDDGSEYVCSFIEFNQQYRPSFDERALKSFFEDMNHYRGRVPDALVEACIYEANKYK